jgi:hypothetical protein
VRVFFQEFWRTSWSTDALLGDRIKGLIFLVLLVSLTAMVGGLVADAFVRRARRQALKDARERAEERQLPPPTVAPEPDLGTFLTLVSPLCANLPISTGASVIFFLLLGLLGLDPEIRWAGAAAAVPALLVLLQYVYLWAHKPAETEATKDNDELESQSERAQKAVESSYGARTLFIRYGFPAIVLLVECLVLAFVLVYPSWFLKLKDEVVYGARFGAMGAYAWVIIELGRRSFRRDVTSGIALWSIVTLAIGPLLAAVLGLIWKKPASGASDAWQLAAVYFYAGFAPRKVLAAVTSAANQLLSGGPTPHVETRTTPLTKLRGINPQIEERLAEEGVENVETLATVEPIRLLRDTPFDLRSILWWIDEALMMVYVPQRWQLLEEQGITGAIDLADLAKRVEDEEAKADKNKSDAKPAVPTIPPAPPAAPPPPPAGGAVPPNPPAAAGDAGVPLSATETLKELAKHISMSPVSFRALAQRIRQDRQVTYVWWLYDRYMTDGDSKPKDPGTPPRQGSTPAVP